MLQELALAIWLLLPAAIANSAPIFAAALPPLKRFDTPLDGGRKFRGRDIFGPHKTWRGLAAGIVVATLVLFLQQLATHQFSWAQWMAGPVDYATLPTLLFGPLLALGALGGDAIESFFKRQQDIPSGKSWLPFDQIDYVLGAILVTLPFFILPPSTYLWMLILWFTMHLASTYVGWLLKLKKDPI